MAEAHTELSLDDLGEVKEELYTARTKWYNVGLKLKVPIDDLDSIRSQYNDPGDQLCEMLKPWLKGDAKSNPKWKVLVEVLRSRLIGESKLAGSLKEKYCKSETESSRVAATHLTGVKSLLFDQLKIQLEPLLKMEFTKKEEGLKADFAKVAVRTYITQSLQSGVALEDIQERLQQLHMEDSLIPGPICKWAQHLANEMHTELNVQSDEPGIGEPTHAQPRSKSQEESLFCKDSVYHASVCSLAVNVCTAGEYQKFFKKSPLVPGHTFQAVSISRSKQDRYLIAKQGDSTYYFAFQSEPKFNQWPKQFTSFSEGIRFQMKKFPIRLIIDLLTNSCRIILTGFSFGGLLACTVAARVWSTTYVPANILKESLACITFGQPHIPVPLLSETATLRPELASTVHSIYLKDDVVPRLSKFLNECCSSLKNPDSESSAVMKVQRQQKMPFQDPVTSQLFKYTEELQETVSGIGDIKTDPTTEETTVLFKLKAMLKDIAPNFTSSVSPQHLPTCAVSYLISCDTPAGLDWKMMSEAEIFVHSGFLQAAEIDDLDVNILFSQHSMAIYCRNVSWAYLEKPPTYTIPKPTVSLEEIKFVKPSINAVEIHHHGNELAVAVEGSDLWFCYRLTVGGQSVDVPAPDISGNSIQFNIPKDGNKIVVDNEKVKVALQNHFSAKSIKQEVTIHVKEYPVTSRQQQLGRLTPSKLIELAYLCALLEQHPSGKFQPTSHKVTVIRQFLENVVRVVPIESIAYTVAYGNAEIALMCAKVIESHQSELPYSELMHDGLLAAGDRIQSGVSPAIIKQMADTAFSKMMYRFPGCLPESVERYTRVMNKTPEQLTVSVTSKNNPQFTGATSLDWRELEHCMSPMLSNTSERGPLCACLVHLANDVMASQKIKEMKQGTITVISGLNIELLYSIGRDITRGRDLTLQCPIDILQEGKKSLASLAKKAQVEAQQVKTLEPKQANRKSMATLNNSVMLKTVNRIRNHDLAICTSLLGGFMEQQVIEIPLVKSQRDCAEALKLAGMASVGVWALSSLNYSDIQPILARCHGNQLLVQIENYVKAIFSEKSMTTEDAQYAAKLQFMVQGMEKVVTCNSQYISYSLERQLVELCDDRKIDISIPLTKLVAQWGVLFKENVLSLVAVSHRPLIARWLKWALMVNNLREKLAEYTTVGVAGLVNSGKSKLVNTLFGIQVPYGTKETKRTTVPFMYNLDEVVEGLDVVDFPGVDDMDETIPDLAELLLTLAQVVIFVVDYRKIHTEPAKVWMDKLGNVPLLVCLTFADKLYAEHMTKDGKHPDKELIKFEIEAERSMILEKLGSVPSRTVRFFSFSQDNDSVLNSEEGRQRLRDVGIGTPLEVGDWLVDVFRNRFGQEELADGLHQFVYKKP